MTPTAREALRATAALPHPIDGSKDPDTTVPATLRAALTAIHARASERK